MSTVSIVPGYPVELEPLTRSQVDGAVHDPLALLWNRACPLSGALVETTRTTAIANPIILVFMADTFEILSTLFPL